MTYKDIIVVWNSRSLLKEGETTDIDGYAPRKFSFADGHTEQALVRNDSRKCSSYQKKLFESPSCLIDVYLWHTKDNSKVYVEATINKYQQPVVVP